MSRLHDQDSCLLEVLTLVSNATSEIYTSHLKISVLGEMNPTLEVFQVTREKIMEQISKAFKEHMQLLASVCLLEEDYASTPKQHGVCLRQRDQQPWKSL